MCLWNRRARIGWLGGEPVDIRVFSFSRILARDVLGSCRDGGDPGVHLEAAISWLKRAHDLSADNGVSYGYSLRGGWRPSYRETSGYLAVTFFDLASRIQDPAYRDRATTICRWLCDVQNADGSISNPECGESRGIVFDTGQVLHGYVRAFQETGEAAFLEAARKASRWLVEVADPEGRWTTDTYGGIPHTYNTRVSWPLLALISNSPDAERERVARANLDWALTQQRDGWFDQCAFDPGVAPFTHTMAYAIRGLLEAGLLLRESKYLDAAFRGGEAVATHVRGDGFIPGQIDTAGNAAAGYCCLTGNCQLAVIWAKLYEQSGDERFRRSAVDALRFVMSCQDVQTSNPNVRGAIKGSHPVWGRYARLTFPNWASKFFVDAMLICSRWMS
ncbi:MAG: hypothetical protein ACE5JS_03465 [Nitrospinota bacterium]